MISLLPYARERSKMGVSKNSLLFTPTFTRSPRNTQGRTVSVNIRVIIRLYHCDFM